MKLDKCKLKQQLTEMFTLQDKFNTDLLGEDWKEQERAWYRHIVGEAVEAQEHLGSKWWKSVNRTPEEIKQGEEQAFIELVDIMHFLMSSIMEKQYYDTHYFDEVVADVANLLIIASKCKVDYENADVLRTLDDIIHERHDPLSGLDLSVVACIQLGYTFDDIYQTYIGKNALNHFRQANGYKSGDYYKIWCGEEDNVWLERGIKKLAAVPELESLFNSVTEYLDKVYSAAKYEGDVRN